jgi:hypothetical protein
MDIEQGLWDLCVMNGGENFLFLIIKPYLSRTTAVCSFTKVEKSAGEKIDLTNGSQDKYNYNAGTIELENLNISPPGCTSTNCGTVKVTN